MIRFITLRILTSIKYLDNNFDEYPKAKKKANDEILQLPTAASGWETPPPYRCVC